MDKMLSLLVPVYNEEEVLPESFRQMDAEMKKIGYPYEIIYVNDGSRDGSMKILRDIAKENPQVKVRSFSRNFGHQTAVTCLACICRLYQIKEVKQRLKCIVIYHISL